MRKIILTVLSLVFFTACTENQRARSFGGTEKVKLPQNRVLLTATWKQDNLWILSKDTLTGKVYFNEKSSFGLVEGTIEFEN